MGFNIGSFLSGPWGAVAGGVLGGLFNKQPSMTPEARRLYQLQLDAANRLNQFSQSVPLSDPGEQAALAQARGLLGEQQRGDRELLATALGQPGQQQNLADALTGLTGQQTGQMMSLNAQALLDALQQRRQALYGAAQTAQGALGAATTMQPGIDFSQLLGNLGQLYGQMQAKKQGMGGMGAMGALKQRPAGPGQVMGTFGRQAAPYAPNFAGVTNFVPPQPANFAQQPPMFPQPGPLIYGANSRL